ncbi:hypothetical protein LO771_06830 [Streptacidiphilus sp. ASG 303]|uniref:hypothetical protein n=1 Tax=Streptacidiphilus sp. ASG 303 TaxID=2896847 RepID=UPI001E291DAC|nr:hypothetical protein [Streptacidiphilus sp. ASG 303]MCD0482138.1 hypothetical protein [Streptacidiphilus sp. ASG 303]
MTQPEQMSNLTIERLCWIAAREQLSRKAHKAGLFGWLAALGAGAVNRRSGSEARTAAGIAGDMRRESASGKMHEYAFAVDDAAGTLTAAEREHLRATGELPEWFLADVERRVAEMRKRK